MQSNLLHSSKSHISVLTSLSKQLHSSKKLTVLGIETSCDDTAVGVVNTTREILAECKYNQWSVHRKLGAASRKSNQLTAFHGGVIPNVAKNLHHENLIQAVSNCIEATPNGWANIDAIALTVKPGLEPCLWEGVQFTKRLLYKYKLPFIPIHHMEGHALTPRLFDKDIQFPFLTLLISGGHCLLALVENEDKFLRLGESIDISPGNFIDKIARKLGLLHINEAFTSAGALLEHLAKQGDPQSFPHIIRSVQEHCWRNKTCDFSFAGFYTAFSRLIDKLVKTESVLIDVEGNQKKVLKSDLLHDISACVQHAVSLQLEDRVTRALNFLEIRNKKVRHVVVSGGVASNLYIKSRVEAVGRKYNVLVSSPPVKYCTDNGVMIAWNGCEKLMANSLDVVLPLEQSVEFFNALKPMARCELGNDIKYQIELLNIKN